jgi:hypothetical protein
MAKRKTATGRKATKKRKTTKKKWAQKAAASIKRRGTSGKFREWCSTHGYGSKVTAACVAAGKRSRDPGVRKMATLAGNYLDMGKEK